MCIRKKKDELHEFIEKYGGLNFDNLVFRPSAPFTSEFGLTERYKTIDGRIVWGYPGIHKGVDRGSSSKKVIGKIDPVFVPFDSGSSGFKDWGGRLWGSDVYLFSKYNFRVRISHMYPDEIKVKDTLTSGYALEAKTYIGPIGSYGNSTANHSHTEIEAWGFNGEWLDSCKLLDSLLKEKYGSEVDTPLSSDEVISIYRTCSETAEWKVDDIKRDYPVLLCSKGICFLNKYKMLIRDSKKRVTTLYSSKYLFGM